MLALALATLVLAAPCATAQRGQAAVQTHRRPMHWVLAVAGAILMGGGSTAYRIANGSNPPSVCNASACAIGLYTLIGGITGYGIGYEYDRLYALRYRNAHPLRIPSIEYSYEGKEPTVIAARDTMAAIGGASGVQILQSGADVVPLGLRGRMLHGITALDIPQRGGFALGAESGLYIYPPGWGPGRLVREGTVSSVAIDRSNVVAAIDRRLELVPLDADSAHAWPGVDLGRHVDGLAADEQRQIVWAVADSEVSGFMVSGDSLLRTARITLPSSGRRVAVGGERLVVALGEHGVVIYDVKNPSAPIGPIVWTLSRFAYDVSLDEARLFVAAGVEGVFVVDLGGERPVTIGLARQLGFATSLVSWGGYTYILDRSGNTLHRINSFF